MVWHALYLARITSLCALGVSGCLIVLLKPLVQGMPHHVLLFVSTDKLEVGILPQNYIRTQHWSKAQGRICVVNHIFLVRFLQKKNVNSIAACNRKLLKRWTAKGILLTQEVGDSIL
jgi:hypothetical protein